MLIYSGVIILSCFMPCFITSLPPQSHNKESDDDNNNNNNNTNESNKNNRNNWSYNRYEYTIENRNGNDRKEETRFGESGTGRYNVNGEESSMNVKYFPFPDEWGYHPLVKYIPSNEYTTQKNLREEPQKNLTNEQQVLPIDNNWYNKNTYRVDLNDDNSNNNNNPIAYQHQRENYQGNQYQTEAVVDFPLTNKKVDEALLLFENFGDKIIKKKIINLYSKELNDYENDTGAVESQTYYVSTESSVDNNGDKTIRVSSENYKNALANFKTQLIKNSEISLNNKKDITTTTTTRKLLPELSRLTFQNFNDSLTDIISEKIQTDIVTVNPQIKKFNLQEPIVVVVPETEIKTTKNNEYSTTNFPCNIENKNKDVELLQSISLTTIPSEQSEEQKSLTDEREQHTIFNNPVNSQLFIRELSNIDQDTTSSIVLNPIQAGLALVNDDKTHFIEHKVEPSLTQVKSNIKPLNQFKLNGYSSFDTTQSDSQIYRFDKEPLKNINSDDSFNTGSNSSSINDRSIKLPIAQNVTLTSINDNDSDKLVEIQKSLELYHSTPIHEIHYPAQLTINHPYNNNNNQHQISDIHKEKNPMSYTDIDLSNSNTDLNIKFLSIINQTSSPTIVQQPINLNNNNNNNNSNNIVFDIEQQKIIEINDHNKNNLTIKNSIVTKIDNTENKEKNKLTEEDQTLSPSELQSEIQNIFGYRINNNNKYHSIGDDKISDETDNSEQTVYIYSPPVVNDNGGYGSIEMPNYNINLPTNSEIVKSLNYPVDKFKIEDIHDINGRSLWPAYSVIKDRVVEKHQKLKQKDKEKEKKMENDVPIIQAYPVTVQKMSKNKAPSLYQPTKTITSTTGTFIHKLVSQPYPIHILEQLPYQVDKVIEMPIRIPTYNPLGEIPSKLPSSSSSSSSLLSMIKSEKLKNNQGYYDNGIRYGITYQEIINPFTNGVYSAKLRETNSGKVESFTNSSTQNFQGYTIGKQTVIPLVAAMRSALSKRYGLLSQYGLVKHQQHQQQQQKQQKQHIIDYYPSINFKKQLYNNNNNNNNNNLLNQLPILMNHPKSVVDQTSFQWHVIHPNEKQKKPKIEYVGPVPSLTPHHVLNPYQNQVPHPAHQESGSSLHYLDPTNSFSSSSLSAPSYFQRIKLPELDYYNKKIGNFRQSKMEYGFKPPMIPSIQYDEETATKIDNR